MNITLVEHWQEHGLVKIIGDGWYWTDKSKELDFTVRHQLQRFESGNPVGATFRQQVRDAGFDPDTCMLSDKVISVYTLDDFKNMTEPQLFGFFALCELDSIELPGPEDYRSVYLNFSVLHDYKGLDGIHKYLANEKMSK